MKFGTECPEKNGRNGRFYTKICIFEVIAFVWLKPLLIDETIMGATEFSSRWNK